MHLGIECELQILDSEGNELIDAVEPLLSTVTESLRAPAPGHVGHDVHACCIEVRTSKHSSIGAAIAEIESLISTVSECASELGLQVQGGGVHPNPGSRELVGTERYRRFAASRGTAFTNAVTFGMHVHVEVRHALFRALGRVRHAVPSMIALTSNSPVERGHCPCACTRLCLRDKIPTSGLPPDLNDTTALDTWIEQQADTGTRCIRDVYWDIRPRPDLNTVEWRLFDSPTTALGIWQNALCAVALTSLAEAATGDELERQDRNELDENRRRAIRHGMKAEFTHRGRSLSAYEVVRADLAIVRSFFEDDPEARERLDQVLLSIRNQE